MAVSGSESFDNPFEQKPNPQNTSSGAKQSAANSAINEKNAKAAADSTFYPPKEPVIISGSSASAKRTRDEEYLAKQQAKYIQYMQGKMPAEEFMASFRGVEGATIEAARAFARPGKADFMSAAEKEKFSAEERYIRRTEGEAAARRFRYKEYLGLTQSEIDDIEQFNLPREKPFSESIRTSVFGGFSAFGIVQTALASFAASIQEANKAINEFTVAAIAGGRATTRLATSPARAFTAALPATGAAVGMGIGSFGGIPGAISGGAAGLITGTIAQMGMDMQLGRIESFDDAVTSATDDLIGLSPELTAQRAMQEVERLQMRIERASQVSDELTAVEQARFDLERATYEQGTEMIRNNAEAFIEILKLLQTMVQNQQSMSGDLIRALMKFGSQPATEPSNAIPFMPLYHP